MTPALAPSAPAILGHRTIGASTGFLAGPYGDWPTLIAQAADVSMVAVELSALSEAELPSLLDFLATTPPLPFGYLAVHGPAKDRELPEAELVDVLAAIAAHAHVVVMHPDVMDDLTLYGRLGSALVLENMDRRKHDGHDAAQLAPYFDALPDAGLCFDIAHMDSVDPSLAKGHELLDTHGHRLRHVHLSSLDGDCHHRALIEDDERRFAPLLDRCRDVPWILEAPPA